MSNTTKKQIVIIAVLALVSASALGAQYITMPAGMIHRAYVTYKDSDEITVKTGFGECNGEFWEITSDTDVDLSSTLPGGEDIIYIYIDDSASSYPTPTIIGEPNEPSWSDTTQGWYFGDDRCIGAVWSPSSGATITGFLAYEDGKIHHTDITKQIGTNMEPDSTWQDTTLACSDYVPVNATHVRVQAGGYDFSPSKTTAVVKIRPKELTYDPVNGIGYGTVWVKDWIPLGASRDIEVYGQDDDDTLNVYLHGWKVTR